MYIKLSRLIKQLMIFLIHTMIDVYRALSLSLFGQYNNEKNKILSKLFNSSFNSTCTSKIIQVGMISMSYVKRIMVHRVARMSLTEFVELSRFAEFKLHIAAA